MVAQIVQDQASFDVTIDLVADDKWAGNQVEQSFKIKYKYPLVFISIFNAILQENVRAICIAPFSIRCIHVVVLNIE